VDVNLRLATLVILAMGLTVGSPLNSWTTPQSEASSQPEVPTQTAHDSPRPLYQRQDTWYEFMLKQFNPDNVDYGSWLERERWMFVENRVKNPYFLYSLCATAGLLVAAGICTKLSIDHRRAMWITAEMMADIYNQDAYSRRIAHQAIEKHNTHIERCNRVIEAAEHGETLATSSPEIEQLRTELMRVAEEKDRAVRDRDIAREDLRRKSEILAEMSVRLEGLTNKSGTTRVTPSSDLRGADAKLVAHINNLQEQLYAERNSNRRLRGG
jgi:hypothetical protein